MTEITARVLADSISYDRDRLTTLEVTANRFILAEINTHRRFSRNSASSRAIPLKKQLERVRTDLAYPISFPAEQPGMQGGAELEGADSEAARDWWRSASQSAAWWAARGGQLGIHKSVVNRVLEPFIWHTVIISSTEWENFFRQRCSPLAQPEFRMLAECMRAAILSSDPVLVSPGEWHLPLIDAEDWVWASNNIDTLTRISAARCARVSYLTHDGVRDQNLDLELFDKLVEAEPPHASPLEHVATPTTMDVPGNFYGWRQLRHLALGF